MVALTQDLGELTDEFALVGEAAANAGRPDAQLRVRRSWASVPAGGHISAVSWGEDSPELVFLHDRRESARARGTGGRAPGPPRGRHRPARARAVRLSPGRAVRAGPDHAGGGRGPTGLGAAGATGGGRRPGGAHRPGPGPAVPVAGPGGRAGQHAAGRTAGPGTRSGSGP